MCEGSTRDTDVEVRAQEANDLKKSMQEAMLDYKKLLRHEVKKVGFLAARDGVSLLSPLTPAPCLCFFFFGWRRKKRPLYLAFVCCGCVRVRGHGCANWRASRR